MEKQPIFVRSDGCGTSYWIAVPTLVIRVVVYAALAIPLLGAIALGLTVARLI